MMSDPMTVITSAKAVVAAIKQGAALAKKAGNQEVYAILLDAQEQTLDLREEVLSLRTERQDLLEQIKALKESLDVRDALEYKKNCYWRQLQDGSEEGPFCSNCYDSHERLLIRLHPVGDTAFPAWLCQTCKAHVDRE